MIEKKVIRFDKGMNDVSVYKDTDIPDDIRNYENIENGEIEKRLVVRSCASMISTYMDGAFNEVYKVFVWYPSNMPSSASGDYCILMFGYDGSNYINRLTFEIPGATWSASAIDCVDYQASSDLRFFVGSDRLLIADNVNRAHFVKINEDGEILQGELGIPAPKTKIQVDKMTDWDEDTFEENDEADGMADCGLFQYTYTVETENGDESNPAPLSETVDLQWFKLTANASDSRWVDRISIENLTIPEGIDDSLVDDIKYFNIYRREVKYSAGADACNLFKVAQVEIKSKYDDSDDPIANSYTDADVISLTTPVDYDNDIAPITKDICEIGGAKVLGGVRTKIGFPFDFQYYCPIKVQNKDTRNYLDAVVRMRICDKDMASSASISNLDWSDFKSASEIESASLKCLRIYDTDGWTPLSVVYDRNSQASRYTDIWVKIPELLANSVHKLYFAWTSDLSSASGVNDSDFQNASYGRFMYSASDSNWDDQLIFQSINVLDNDNLICAPMDLGGRSTNLDYINKYRWDQLSAATPSYVSPIAKMKTLDRLVGSYAMEIDNETKENSFIPTTMPDKGYVAGFVKFDVNAANVEDGKDLEILSLGKDNTEEVKLYLVVDQHVGDDNDTWDWNVKVIGGSNDIDEVLSGIPTVEYGHTEYFFIFFSWNNDTDDLDIYMYDFGSDTPYTFNYTTTLDFSLNYLCFGDNGIGTAITPNNIKFDQWQFVRDTYIDKDDRKIKHILDFIPPYDEIIGYDYDTPAHNQLITFDDVESIDFKDRLNMLKWSSINGLGFPDTYIKKVYENVKRILPAPSFLPFEYQNTVLIFTRNNIYRFILEGTASEWAAATSNLIPEKQRIGLLAEDSLVVTGDSVLWLSEVGVIRWSPQGLSLISKDIIDIPLDEDMIGFYVPLRNQYILHRNSTNISYVFDLNEEKWTTFDDLDIGDTAILSGGDATENVNYLLQASSVVLDTYPHPSASYVTGGVVNQFSDAFSSAFGFRGVVDAYVEKEIEVGYADFLSYVVDFDGSASLDVKVFNSKFASASIENTKTITSLQKHNLPRGYYGNKIKFKIKDPDKLRTLLLKYRPRKTRK